MLRGFVDTSIYETGIGTKNAARYFAARGFVTLAPDFLGYGDSDAPPLDTMAARLEKPAQLLDLIDSLNTLSFINPTKLGIWGHSNGGQIALSLLEITAKPIPTVLWAPVTKPFPYSLLYYTDEYEDGGKALRKTLADFETNYDVFHYSLDKYIDRLAGPIQLHQGGQDDAVPQAWSDAFVNSVNQNQEKIEYFIYPTADHNLQPEWNSAVQRSYQFFTTQLEP
jgi:dipeptidyl-peptidase-4